MEFEVPDLESLPPAAPAEAPVVVVEKKVVRVKRDPKTGHFLGVGRRKKAVASVRLIAGKGEITVNGRPFAEYFKNERDRMHVVGPLEKTGKREAVDITVKVVGGGPTGQAEACMMGIARALICMDIDLHPSMRADRYLTRDSRMKERKHYGLRGARRGTQFSKR